MKYTLYKSLHEIPLGKFTDHLIPNALPKVIRNHCVNAFIANNSKTMIINSNIKKNPVSKFGFVHF